jgi:hypothetical protein
MVFESWILHWWTPSNRKLLPRTRHCSVCWEWHPLRSTIKTNHPKNRLALLRRKRHSFHPPPWCNIGGVPLGHMQMSKQLGQKCDALSCWGFCPVCEHLFINVFVMNMDMNPLRPLDNYWYGKSTQSMKLCLWIFIQLHGHEFNLISFTTFEFNFLTSPGYLCCDGQTPYHRPTKNGASAISNKSACMLSSHSLYYIDNEVPKR